MQFAALSEIGDFNTHLLTLYAHESDVDRLGQKRQSILTTSTSIFAKAKAKAQAKSKAKANAKIVSPLAARGIEIKRNLANRRQASSVPQREVDIDKELESWKKKEEEVE